MLDKFCWVFTILGSFWGLMGHVALKWYVWRWDGTFDVGMVRLTLEWCVWRWGVRLALKFLDL